MATNQSIIDRVRLELGDQSSTFDITVTGNGTAVRYETGTYPLDGAALVITVDGQEVTDAEVEERTGVVTFDSAPGAGADVRFRGVKFRYFGAVDLQRFIDAAVLEHTTHRTDAFGRALNLANLPGVEEYPLAILATVKALWALATDASFDIDILAPDGVNIPRAERYRQLMEMIDARMTQYKDLCTALNIGLYRIEVFNLRRVSKMTGRMVPVYVEREIEDNSPPMRVYLPANTYGADALPSSAGQVDLTCVQGDDFYADLDFADDVTGWTFKSQVRVFETSQTISAEFTITVLDAPNGIVRISLPGTKTKTLGTNNVWDIQVTRAGQTLTPIKGRFFVQREVTR